MDKELFKLVLDERDEYLYSLWCKESDKESKEEDIAPAQEFIKLLTKILMFAVKE